MTGSLIQYLSGKTSAALVAFAIWLPGIGSVLSFNLRADVKPIANKTVFDLMNDLTANLMMSIGGMLIASFAGWFMRCNTLTEELRIGSR